MDKKNTHLNDRVLIYAVLWGLSYVGTLFAIKSTDIPFEVSITLTTVTVLAFILLIYKYYRSIYFMDEVQIKIQMEAFVFAFSMTLLLIMTLGLLDLFIILNKADWSYRYIFPILICFYFIGIYISKGKYNYENEKHH